MGFFSLVLALLIEQWRPLADRKSLFVPAERFASFLEQQFNAGESQHGVIAWLCAVLPVVLGTWLLYAALVHASTLLALAFNVGALYLTLGFRRFSHSFTEIQQALKEGEVEHARLLLSQWRGHDCRELSVEEISRLTLEQAIAASHRNVFAVAFWFLLLPGPSGAVLYRTASYLRYRWSPERSAEFEGFGRFPLLAFQALDWLPARFTATSFAVVGDFEDAVFCWRSQAKQWAEESLGVVLAAGAGALGVRLGSPYVCDGVVVERPELGVGERADPGFLDSVVGLMWRALVLWMVIILVLDLARAVA